MKLTFKTLQQQVFTLDVEDSATVGHLKSLIQASQGFDAGAQKLIHSGKILENEKPLSEYKIAEKDFVVVMVTKPKPAAPAPVPVPVPVSTPAPVVSTPVPVVAAPANTPTTTTSTTDNALATGTVYEAAVNGLVEMGFERPQVLRAMKAAFNNPDRAAEYLMTGIPESVAREFAAPSPAAASAGSTSTPAPVTASVPAAAAPQGATLNLFEAAAAQAAQGATPGRQPAASGAAPSADSAAQFAMLRQSPQFQQMRQLVMAQPELLQPLLQQLGQSSPGIMQLIQSHPEEFLSLLGGDAGDFEDVGGEEGEGGQYVTISPEDDAAINRLVALGFDRNQAAEAFLACDKNEELAANYLFDQMGNDF